MASISELGRGAQQINARAPDELHERLKEAAIQNRRTLNAEIVHRLEASFDDHAVLDRGIAALINRHIERQVTTRLRGGNVFNVGDRVVDIYSDDEAVVRSADGDAIAVEWLEGGEPSGLVGTWPADEFNLVKGGAS